MVDCNRGALASSFGVELFNHPGFVGLVLIRVRFDHRFEDDDR
jgi:hypothetical protein